MNKIKVMSVFGTRPEAIKMAPLVRALQASESIESIVCLTGQHREMLDSVMDIFHLKSDYDLNIMEKRQTLSTITTKTLLGMEQVLEEANRIERKHLITLEPAVSVDYTNAMRDSKLQLVIPSQLFPTYTPSQQEWLMDVGGFCEMVEERQRVLD